MKRWRMVVAGILCFSILISGSAIASAAEVDISDQTPELYEDADIERGEFTYQEDLDEADPENANANKSLYDVSKESITLYSGSAVANSSIQTQWNGATFYHNDQNTNGITPTVGIDVSYHQGDIDFSKVKAAGIQFVFLRVGYRAYVSGSLATDVKFNTYIKDAKAAGLKVGVYFFSQAISEAEGVEEAEYILEQIKPYSIELPVVFDFEYIAEGVGRLYHAHLTKAQKTAVANAFCKTVKQSGYQPMVYSSSSWFCTELDADSIRQNSLLWMARYNKTSYNADTDSSGERYSGKIDYWQCSSKATVDGITGNVDLDYSYYLINEVYQHSDGNWCYYVNGSPDYTYTGVAKSQIGWLYIKDGIADFSYNGFASNQYGTWRIENGVVNLDYNGFMADAENNWYYLENGKVQTSVSSVIKGTVNGITGWWHVVNGRVAFTDTIAKNSNGWWYIKNGMVDFSHYGVEQNSNGWWRIEGGKVNFGFNGFAENSNGWWYLEEGRVQFGTNNVIKGTVDGTDGWWYVVGGKVIFTDTVAKNSNGWWYIKNGMVDFSHYGVEQNSNGWWRIEGGKVNFGFNGFAENSNGWWYLEEGRVQFGTNDVIKGTVDGTDGWWYVVGGKVIFTDTVAKNNNGWWYIKNGMVDFSHYGVEQNSNGWWRIEGGKVNFGFNGFAENSNGWWYLEEGRVQFGTNDVIKGTVDGTDGWWYVVGGKVTFTDTVAKNNNGWWYIKDGMVDFSHYGVEQNSNGWWRIEGGKVNFGFNGFAENSNGWWCLEGGKVQFDKTGVIEGLVEKTDGLWYVENGKVDLNYSGTVSVDGESYTVYNGKADLPDEAESDAYEFGKDEL